MVKVEILSQNFKSAQKLRTANFSCVAEIDTTAGNACCLMFDVV